MRYLTNIDKRVPADKISVIILFKGYHHSFLVNVIQSSRRSAQFIWSAPFCLWFMTIFMYFHVSFCFNFGSFFLTQILTIVFLCLRHSCLERFHTENEQKIVVGNKNLCFDSFRGSRKK